MLVTHRLHPPRRDAEIIDFDDALFAGCTPQLQADLLAEASMLAQAFAPEGGPEALREMARELSSGVRDGEMGRVRARQLAGALKRLAAAPSAGSRLLSRSG